MDMTLSLLAILSAGVAACFAALTFFGRSRQSSQESVQLTLVRDLVDRFDRLEGAQQQLARELRGEIKIAGQDGRGELSQNLSQFQMALVQQMTSIATVQNSQIVGFSQTLTKLTEKNEAQLDLFRGDARSGRDESGATLRRFGEQLQQQLMALGEGNERKLTALRVTVEAGLKEIETQNAAKLEEMRRTVDEKLHATLEQRLGESFKQVSDRLEQVHKGLGEMQLLASGVGDLKRVLTNVKTRGTWGEVQLGSLLGQLMTTDQYATNVCTRPHSNDRVEFAIRLPGRDGQGQVWLPIDSKFPIEDYERMGAAQDLADAVALEEAAKALEIRIKGEGRAIRDKYIEPPHTTDFAILFLPTEGLYAEVLRRPGLSDWLQRECRVTVAGPTTLTALLNSLQMGFRTLAIEKRASDVWMVLGAVKTEFQNFGKVLAKTKAQLQTVTNSIDQAEMRTRQMDRKLKDVEALPEADASLVLETIAEPEPLRPPLVAVES